jgi:hypothetical protein
VFVSAYIVAVAAVVTVDVDIWIFPVPHQPAATADVWHYSGGDWLGWLAD